MLHCKTVFHMQHCIFTPNLEYSAVLSEYVYPLIFLYTAIKQTFIVFYQHNISSHACHDSRQSQSVCLSTNLVQTEISQLSDEFLYICLYKQVPRVWIVISLVNSWPFI